jgi:AcrR family transcriptional regulator
MGEVVVMGEARGSAVAARRRARQHEIVAATRALFDERGMRDANIDDIAKSVGINRTIIYRHVASKEELFALTLAEYLKEVRARIEEADDEAADPIARLRRMGEIFTEYSLQYPAFLDCAFALLRKPGGDLLADIGDSALLRLGRLMAILLGRIAGILRVGKEKGVFDFEDADLSASLMYTSLLGMLHMSRIGFLVKGGADPSLPELVSVDVHQISRVAVRNAILAVLVQGVVLPD